MFILPNIYFTKFYSTVSLTVKYLGCFLKEVGGSEYI